MTASAAEPLGAFVVRVGVLAAVVAVLVGAGGAMSGVGLVPLAAQEASGVVADRWAPVVVDREGPPEVAVSGFWLDPATTPGGSRASVVVAVALGESPWRVSVSVGDPLGARTRASAVGVDQTVSGLVERGDGTRWDDAGTTSATMGDDGRITVEVPLDGVGADAVAWVEAEATVDGGIVTSVTPWFALADLLGDRPGPALGVAPVAGVTDGADAGPVALLEPGPTVAVVGRGLEVTTTEPTPVAVDGMAVVGVVDTVYVARDGAAGQVRTDRVEIDRGTGEVRLVSADGEPVVAEPGTAPWLVSAPSPTDPGASATVTFDIEALDVALGGPVLERATTAVGVTRAVALADGRTLQAAGVVGTMAWFDTALVAAAPAADAETGAVREATAATTVLVAAVVVLVVVLAAAVVFVRRRRGRRWARSGGATPESAQAVAPAASRGAGDGAAGARVGVEGRDPLAALLAEVDELSARVDRLGSAGGEAGPGPGPGSDTVGRAGPGR